MSSFLDKLDEVPDEDAPAIDTQDESMSFMDKLDADTPPPEAPETTLGIDDDAWSAFGESFKHGAMSSVDGMQQIAGYDEEDNKAEAAEIRRLQEGEHATASYLGEGLGMFFDPVAWATLGFGRLAQGTKVVKKVSDALDTMSTVKKSAVVGGTAGGAWSGIGYVDEEGGETRGGNVTSGIIGGTVLGAGAGKLSSWYGARKLRIANEKAQAALDDYRYEIASKVNDGGVSMQKAMAEVKKEQPELWAKAQQVRAETGQDIGLKRAIDDYGVESHVETGTMSLDANPGRSKAAWTGMKQSVDKFIGVLSTQVKNISPKVAGSLKEMESKLLFRPEQYVRRRQRFGDYFPSSTGRKQVDPTIVPYNAEETAELNQMLLSGNFTGAKKFLKRTRGTNAVEAFDETISVLKELGGEMKKLGIIPKEIKNYYPRVIPKENLDGYMEAMQKTLTKKQSESWETILKKENTKLTGSEGRGWAMSPAEEMALFQRRFLGDKADIHINRFAKDRKIKAIPQEFVKFYNDPIASFDAHIHNAIREIETAKFLGQKSYQAGLKNVGGEEGVFNLNKALDSSSIFKGLDEPQAAELMELMRVRFGTAMQGSGTAMQLYKGITNIALLGNFKSALTQVGDLGTSMYRNGMIRSTKEIMGGWLNKNPNKIKLEDVGLETNRFTEFEDYGKNLGGLKKAQDWAFMLSGFRGMDRLGKETFMNAALDRAVSMSKKGSGFEYRQWAKKYRGMWGEQKFKSLEKELGAYNKGDKPSDEMLTYVLTELMDIQPISKSEMPPAYFSDMKAFYTLKSFMLKQLDLVRNDIIDKAKTGGPDEVMEAGVNLVRYVTMLGAAGVSAKWLKSKLLDDATASPFVDMPDGPSTMMIPHLAAELGLANAEIFGMGEYTLGKIAQDGVTGFIHTLLPPTAVLGDAVGEGIKVVTGATTPEESYKALADDMLGYMPFVGKNLKEGYIPFIGYDTRPDPQMTSDAPPLGGEAPALQGDAPALQSFAAGGAVLNPTESIDNPRVKAKTDSYNSVIGKEKQVVGAPEKLEVPKMNIPATPQVQQIPEATPEQIKEVEENPEVLVEQEVVPPSEPLEIPKPSNREIRDRFGLDINTDNEVENAKREYLRQAFPTEEELARPTLSIDSRNYDDETEEVEETGNTIEDWVAEKLGIKEEDLKQARDIGKSFGDNQEYYGRGDAARHAALGWLASRTESPKLALMAIQSKEGLDALSTSDAGRDYSNNLKGFSIQADNWEDAQVAIHKMIEDETLEFNPEGAEGEYTDKKAEGGSVKKPEVQRIDPGLYKDEGGQYWKVDKSGDMEIYSFE